MTALQNWQ